MKRGREATPGSSSGVGPRGLHQKLADSQQQVAQTPSKLANLLVDHWSWGAISSPFLQEVAAAAKADFELAGATAPRDIVALSSIGGSGLYPQNMHRDLVKFKLATPPLAPAMSKINMWVKKTHYRIEEVPQSVLLPHALFGQLYKHDKAEFKSRALGGSEDNIARFWDQIAHTKRYNDHPIRTKSDHKTKCVPIGVHGDGVQVVGVGRSWSKGVEAFSWSSLLAIGNTVMINFLIWICFARCMCSSPDKHTMCKVWKELRWSL